MRKITRRQFLKRSTTALSAVAAVPYIVRSSALGRGGSVAASERESRWEVSALAGRARVICVIS
jgi:hypothetical protein